MFDSHTDHNIFFFDREQLWLQSWDKNKTYIECYDWYLIFQHAKVPKCQPCYEDLWVVSSTKRISVGTCPFWHPNHTLFCTFRQSEKAMIIFCWPAFMLDSVSVWREYCHGSTSNFGKIGTIPLANPLWQPWHYSLSHGQRLDSDMKMH